MRDDGILYAEGYLAIISYGDELDYRCITQFRSNDDCDLESIIGHLIFEVNRSGGAFQLYRRLIDLGTGKFVSLDKILDCPWVNCKEV